jgi:hypothetical protein
MTRKTKKALSFGLTMLATLLGGVNMIEQGHVRPGWLTVAAAGVSGLIYFFKKSREEHNS